MDQPFDYEKELHDLSGLAEYLEDNVRWHLWRSSPWHSYPCAIWTEGRNTLSWEVLRNHGLIPPNVGLIEDEPPDVL